MGIGVGATVGATVGSTVGASVGGTSTVGSSTTGASVGAGAGAQDASAKEATSTIAKLRNKALFGFFIYSSLWNLIFYTIYQSVPVFNNYNLNLSIFWKIGLKMTG
jgi:hypothetical protein